MKEEMAKLKDNKDKTSTEKFKYVAVLWNQKKEGEVVKEDEKEVKTEKKQKKTKK